MAYKVHGTYFSFNMVTLELNVVINVYGNMPIENNVNIIAVNRINMRNLH